jgi:hypothetical protein
MGILMEVKSTKISTSIPTHMGIRYARLRKAILMK